MPTSAMGANLCSNPRLQSLHQRDSLFMKLCLSVNLWWYPRSLANLLWIQFYWRLGRIWCTIVEIIEYCEKVHTFLSFYYLACALQSRYLICLSFPTQKQVNDGWKRPEAKIWPCSISTSNALISRHNEPHYPFNCLEAKYKLFLKIILV